MKVEGIGMNTAILIKLVPAVNRRYLEDRALRGMRAVSSEACGELLVSKFNGVTVERVLLLCMNNQGRVLHCVSISEGTQSMVDINNRRIVEAALRHNASCVVLGHNHPNGVAVPSRTDVETTCMLARLLRSMDIWLYDHIIVADGEYFSMARCNKFEQFFLKIQKGATRRMRCETYPLHTLGTYQFVVIISVYRGKLMLSRHKNRSTWETQGGHIEGGESLIEAAGRELYEESGAVKYLLSPAFDYRAGDENLWGNGVVFIAEIDEIGALPESEMEEVAFFYQLPPNLTYPEITPVLLQKAKEAGLL